MNMELKIFLLRKLRLFPFLPRKLTARLTNAFLPLDPNDAKDDSQLHYPIMKARYFGLSYELDLNEHVEFWAYFDGVYDFRTVYLMRRILARIDAPVYMDVGANIGNHLLPVARLVKKVIAFEPNPLMIRKLEDNLKRNNIDNVLLSNFGLSNANEELPFYSNPVNPGTGSFVAEGNSLNRATAANILSVKIGDEVVNKTELSKLDFVKIDVEGYEYEVITGLRKTLEFFKPIVMFEFMGKASHRKFQSLKSLYGLFPKGYHVCALGSSIRARYFDHNAYDKPKLILYGKDYSNLIAFPKDKYSLVFGKGNQRG